MTKNTDVKKLVQETKLVEQANKPWQRKEERKILFPEWLFSFKWPVFNKNSKTYKEARNCGTIHTEKTVTSSCTPGSKGLGLTEQIL